MVKRLSSVGDLVVSKWNSRRIVIWRLIEKKGVNMNRIMKASVLCGVVALGAGMFIGCKEQCVGTADLAQIFAEEALRDGSEGA